MSDGGGVGGAFAQSGDGRFDDAAIPDDEQTSAERLDDDKAGENPAESELSLGVAGDEPLGVEDVGITPLEESGGESVRERDARTVPDGDLREPPHATAGLLDPDDEFGDDETKELVGVMGDEPDLLSPEEAAIHEREPLTDDLEEEPLVDLRERLDGPS
jgi:hypothetical protein